MRIEDQPRQRRIVYLGLSGVVAALSILGLFGLWQVVQGGDFLKGALVFCLPLGLSIWGGFKAYRMDMVPRALLEADEGGVALLGREKLAWSEVEAVLHRQQNVGYGPMDMIGIRRKFTPSGTGATFAERVVRNALSDRSFPPSSAGVSAKDILAGLDAEMAKAGYRRGAQKCKERGAYRTWTWVIERSSGEPR